MAYRNYSVANGFIVDKLGNGDFTTIASALTAATSDDTIFIRPGTYTENLTLVVGVNLTAFESDAAGGTVIINGNCTLSTAGTVTISGIELQTNSANNITVSGSAASILNLINCNINCLNNTGISFSSSSGSSVINVNNCTGNLGTTGIALFAHSAAGNLIFTGCSITNTGASTTASTCSSGLISLVSTLIKSPITTSSTGVIATLQSSIDPGAFNTTALTHGGSSASNVNFTTFGSGTASAVSISTTLTMIKCSINSTNATAVVTGGGTINYQSMTFSNSGTVINTTTQTNSGTLIGSKNTAPSSGFLGQQIRATVVQGSASPLMNNTGLNVTSINLTAGVWDVTGIIGFIGTPTGGTQTNASVNTTSATLGIIGDNAVQSPTLSTGTSDYYLTVPSYRIVISSTTPVYLVAAALFSGGAISAYGRISATRVG